MSIRRLLVALVAALVISGGVTYVFYARIRSQRAAQPQLIKIVAAANSLEAGAALTSDNMTLVDWPSNLPLPGSFTKVADLVGRSLIYPVNPKEPILERDVAVAGSGIGLTVKIPEGMRATAVRSNEIVGVAGFLYPRSHVDVLVTYRPENSSAPITQTVLQNVEVLTAGQRIEPDPQGKPETVNVVTLLLTPEDSQKVILAGTQGSIQFILRNGADKGSVASKPVSMAALAATPPSSELKPVSASRRAPVSVRPRTPEIHLVETIAGEKRTTDKF